MSPNWRKSSYSGNGGAECVEAGRIPGVILVRDTTQYGTGPMLRLAPADWTRFLRGISTGLTPSGSVGHR